MFYSNYKPYCKNRKYIFFLFLHKTVITHDKPVTLLTRTDNNCGLMLENVPLNETKT